MFARGSKTRFGVVAVWWLLGPCLGPVVAQDTADPVAALQSLLDEKRYDEVQEAGARFLAGVQDDALVSAAILDRMVAAAFEGGRSAQPEAQELARRAIDENVAAHGEQHPDVAIAIRRYAKILFAAGALEASREQHQRALTLREAILPANDPGIADAAMDLGGVLSRLARYDEARAVLARALSIRETIDGPDHPKVADVLQNIGNNLLRAGDYVAARDAYERALTIKEASLEPDDPALARTLISLGVLERMSGNYDTSRERYERALAITEASLGDEHPLTLAARNNLGNLLNDTGQYAKALPLYERTLALREARLGPDHPEVAETNFNLGILSLRMGEDEPAERFLAKALDIWERSLGPDHPSIAFALESTANLYFDRGDVGTALPFYTRALEIRATRLDPEHPDLGKSHLLLAAAQLEHGDRSDALRSVTAAAAILEGHLRETIAYLPERQGLALAATQFDPGAVLFAGLLSAEHDRDAWATACWEWTLRRRGLVQEELAVRNRRVLEGDTAQAREAWSRYGEARAALGDVWVEGPGDDEAAFLAALQKARVQKEQAESDLAKVSAEFARRQSIEQAGVSALTTALGSSGALVEIVRVALDLPVGAEGPTHDVALVLTSDGVDGVDLGPSAEIDRLVQDWRTALDEAELAAAQPWRAGELMQLLDESSRALRRVAWDPIEDRVAAAETVYFVPDGAYHLVDLHALRRDDDRYLLEDGPSIRLLDSGRDLARFAAGVPAKAGGPASILAVGGVDFDARAMTELASTSTDAALYRGPSSTCSALREMQWAPLPESMQELAAVDLAFGPAVTTLTGPLATETHFKLEAPGRRILHLATHGFFLQGRCVADTEENPLLLSGLVFAGANPASAGELASGDDGIVTAEEFAALDLRGVELAVLSACDTGRGEIAAGEGVFGLRRAFHVAGARTVVMSLWPVPDAAARSWMTTFYDRIGAAEPVADAVRAASLRRLQELRAAGRPDHPREWAGFVAVGDWK